MKQRIMNMIIRCEKFMSTLTEKQEKDRIKCMIYTKKFFEPIYFFAQECEDDFEDVDNIFDKIDEMWGHEIISGRIEEMLDGLNNNKIIKMLSEYKPISGRHDITDEEVEEFLNKDKNEEEDEDEDDEEDEEKLTFLQITINEGEDEDNIQAFKSLVKDVFECGNYDEYEKTTNIMFGRFSDILVWPLISQICRGLESNNRDWTLLNCKVAKDRIDAIFGTHPFA